MPTLFTFCTVSNMATKSMRKDALQTTADELEKVLDQIEELNALMTPFKDKETELRTKLLETMQKKGYKYVSATSGLGWGITLGRKTFAIKKGMEETALEWAKKNFPSILTLSNPKLNQVVKPMLELPAFIEEKVGEPFLTVHNNSSEE